MDAKGCIQPVMTAHLSIRVCALYRFARFDAPDRLRGPLQAICDKGGVRGTLLLAREGINGTIAGSPDAIDAVLAHIRTLPGCDRLSVKDSWTDRLPFYRMKVRLKQEIVTMGQPDIDPLEDVGQYVQAADWNALISDPETILIDTRNDYEVEIGTFAGAIDPRTTTFREFPDWFRTHRDALLKDGRAPKIAMFCTGGIRCEKATAFVKAEGLSEVFHLDGGILKYLETVPADASLWRGECFVFDQRVSVGHGLVAGVHSLCHACRRPVSPEGRADPRYVEGVSCAACHDARDEAQRAGYTERQRQMALADRRGVEHVGARPVRRASET